MEAGDDAAQIEIDMAQALVSLVDSEGPVAPQGELLTDDSGEQFANATDGATAGVHASVIEHATDGATAGVHDFVEEIPVEEIEQRRRLIKLGPLHRPAGRRRSQVWEHVRLLADMDRRRLTIVKGNHVTHRCVYCNELLFIAWRTTVKGKRNRKGIHAGCYLTMAASRHLQGCELGGAAAIVPMEAKRDNLARKRHLNLVTSIERQVVNKRMKQTSIPNVPSYHDQIICGQAHWFIYSSACVSLEVFRDNYFKSMLHAMIPPSATVPKTLVLTIPRLKLMINAEWLAFIRILRHELQKKFQDGLGNTFCQFIHDGCTLESQSKYQAFGLQYTDSNFASNNVVALTFRRARSSAGESVVNLAREEVFNTTGYRFDQIIGCSVQDAAARSVAAHLQLEEETCDMHDGDKIGRSAIGELLRTRNKVAINSFPAGMFIVLTYLFFILYYH